MTHNHNTDSCSSHGDRLKKCAVIISRLHYMAKVGLQVYSSRGIYIACALIALIAAEIAKSEDNITGIMRFVEGIDAASIPMGNCEVSKQLNDPWATHILLKGVLPNNVQDALIALKDDNPAQVQQSFFVSESGHISSQNANSLPREFRMVVTRQDPADSLPTVLLSAPAGDRSGFIELMSWDATKNSFNFYRRPSNGRWTWKGDSHNAAKTETQGKGCFACHVNGVPVMKELKIPWNNWHAQSASIAPEAITDAQILQSDLWLKKSQAEQLEPTIRAWTVKATASRVSDSIRNGTVVDARRLLRPLFVTTTVNLTTSRVKSSSNDDVRVPPTFFLNFDLLETEFQIRKPPGFSLAVKRPLYRNALTTFGFHLQENQFSLRGDTNFAFLVPEPSFEDVALIQEIVRQNIVSLRFAICALLVDFPNPIFSSKREALLAYVPETGSFQNGSSDLSERTAKAIVDATKTAPSRLAEREFASWWKVAPDQLVDEATRQVQQYLTKAQAHLQSQQGVDAYMRLAESRRNRFSHSRLNEFPLLLPRTNIPAEDRQMTMQGEVRP
jgi:hypothetical protein